MGALLITSNKKIFEISDDGCIIEFDEFACVGSGANFTLGTLDWLYNNKEKHGMKLQDILVASVEQAMKYNESCGGRVDVFHF